MRVFELYADSHGGSDYFATREEAEAALIGPEWRNTIRCYIAFSEYEVTEGNLIAFLNGKLKPVQNLDPDDAVVRVSARPGIKVLDEGSSQESPPDVALRGLQPPDC